MRAAEESRHGPRRVPPAPLLLLGVAALTAALVAVLHRVDLGAAMAFGAVSSGLLAVGGGLLLLHREARPGTPHRFRQWIGAALLVWGLGQVVQGVIAFTSTPFFPTPGDITSFVAAPLAVVGVLTIPRRRAAHSPTWRLTVDSALLAITGALLVWRFGFVDVFTDDGTLMLDAAGGFAVLVLVADLMIATLTLLAGVRDLDRNMLLVGAGVACYAVGDLLTLHQVLSAGMWPWQGALLWCLAWPIIALGLLRYEPLAVGGAGTRADPDARVVLATTCVALALLVIGVVGVIVSGSSTPDPVSLWFVVGALVVLAGREALNTRLRGRLLARLHEEATVDPLTGLANRRVLVGRLRTVPRDEPWALLTVDLDGFKEVNAVLGHPTGDLLLVAAAARIADAAPPGALVCRIGGDEFGVLVPGDLATAAHVGERLVTAVRRSAAGVAGVERVGVSASVGVAAVGGPEVTDGEPGEAADRLASLSAAGSALRAAKTSGRDTVAVFDEESARVRRRRLLVEERLRHAVAHGMIDVAFQPIVDLRCGLITGAEALARWTDPQLGVVDPAEFIPVAEETGLVVALGEVVLDRSLAAAAEHDFTALGVRVSCNVSPIQLRVPGFHTVVTEALAAHGVPPEVLIVEITEAVLVEEHGPAVLTLRLLAEAGVTIAIDDFGTGYSALGYLRRLPAHVLKVDRSLTGALGVEAQARAIVRAVVDLGRSIGLTVVVEGIESRETAETVSGIGAGYGQGSMFGEAVPVADLVAAVRSRGFDTTRTEPAEVELPDRANGTSAGRRRRTA